MEGNFFGSLVAVAGTLQLVGLTWVGGRMLLLARRTRETPELLLGLSLLLIDCVGAPLLGVAGYGAAHVREMSLPLFAIAIGLTDLGALLFLAFVARVFRPGSAAARGVLAVATAALAVHAALVVSAISTAPPEAAPLAVLGLRGLILACVMTSGFGWGSVESFIYWGRLRRQRALGLADAHAVRRMGLFALGCGAPLMLMGAVATAIARGLNPLTDPLTALGIAIGALVTGGAFSLVFGGGRSTAQTAPA